jgi:hypothetical protein
MANRQAATVHEPHGYTERMACVFLSYARADLDYVKRLERFLKDEGIETWFDQEIGLFAMNVGGQPRHVIEGDG